MRHDRLRAATRVGGAAVVGLIAAAVAVAVLPTCSDLGGGDPVYCVGGLSSLGAIRLALVALVVWRTTVWLLLR
ncbi:hypothetical protein [Halomicrobium salinisoli]|uniref:hypothetical protein n=1 Tax=Halomicrobium salinisoli TaxID=2878391 RepID=UPI001CF0C329|nr:hypothetical protein [Halomicrobium salinisoli]